MPGNLFTYEAERPQKDPDTGVRKVQEGETLILI